MALPRERGRPVRPPDVDEPKIKAGLRTSGVANEAFADALAEAKALDVSNASPQALVLGCDQVLVCGDRLFDKAHNTAEARQTLATLRGKDHYLISACVLAQGGKPVWRYKLPTPATRITMLTPIDTTTTTGGFGPGGNRGGFGGPGGEAAAEREG